MIAWLRCDADHLRLHLGKRILLLGCPGSGKTTLAKLLGPILNIQLFHLDDYYWKEDGTCPEEDKWLETLCSFAMRESWIIEGNHLSAFEMRIKRADSVILLAPTTRVCLWRVLKRGVQVYFQEIFHPPPLEPRDPISLISIPIFYLGYSTSTASNANSSLNAWAG
jgi:adenylate kinase family enzyme